MKRFFLIWLIAELLVFTYLAHWIGFLWTLGLFFLPTLIGKFIFRYHGQQLMQKMMSSIMQSTFSNPANPPHDLVQKAQDSIAFSMGVALWMIPGLVSTAVACLLFLPLTRRPVFRWLFGSLMRSVQTRTSTQQTPFQETSMSSHTHDTRSQGPHTPSEKHSGRIIDHDLKD